MRPTHLSTAIFFLSCIFWCNLGNAQTDLDNSIYEKREPINLVKSPNAASLGQYGAIEASLFTGLAGVDIPVFSVSEGDIPISASLSYNTGGVKPEDHPGWVGSNWTLSVGSVVTRKQNGEIDELPFYNGPDTNLLAYYYKYSLLNNADWYTDTYINNHNPFLNTTGLPACDLEPDEFYFSLPGGGSGSFLLNHLGEWQVKSTSPGKFRVNVSLKNNYTLMGLVDPGNHHQINIKRIIYSFTIINADGVKYTFGNNDNAIEFSRSPIKTNPDGSNSQVIASAWYLSKIESPKGNSVNYLYDRGENQYLQQVSYRNDYMKPYMMSIQPRGYSCTIVTPAYLKEINSSSFKIQFKRVPSTQLAFPYSQNNFASLEGFDYGDLYFNSTHTGAHLFAASPPVWYELREIDLKNTKGELINAFQFTYNNNPAERLMLQKFSKGITDILEAETGLMMPDGTEIAYSFAYNNPSSLPAYNSMQTDQWGYYNGIPFGPADPQPSPQWAASYFKGDSIKVKAGTLSKIIYPTGGSTTFIYEMNDYGKRLEVQGNTIALLSQPGTGGGLRIKKMIDSSLAGVPVTKTYDYTNDNGISSGIMAGNRQITFTSVFTNPNVELTVGGNSQLNQPDYTNGKDVVYSQIKEILGDGSYSIYKYANSDSLTFRDEPPLHVDARQYFTGNGFSAGTVEASVYSYPRITPVSRELERGLLISKSAYNVNGQMVYHLQNKYRDDPSRFNEYVRAYDTKELSVYDGNTTGIKVYGQAMKIYTYYPYIKEQIETNYDIVGQHPVSVTRHFNYDNDYRLLSTDTVWGSDQQPLVTSYKRPYNNTDQVSVEMKAAGQISSITEQTQYKNGQQLQWKKTQYFKDNYNHYLPKMALAKLLNGGLDTLASFVTYDQVGNFQQIHNADGQEECYLWGYNHQYPVAKVTGSGISLTQLQTMIRQSMLDSAAFYTDESIRTELNKIRTGFGNAKVEIRLYTYKPLIGMTSETDPAGNITYYEYDVYGRLIFIKDSNKHIIKSYKYHYKSQTNTQ